MRHVARPGVEPKLMVGAAGAATPAVLLGALAHDHAQFSAVTHFAGVGLTACAAAVASILLTLVGAQRGDGRTVLVGAAFSVMAALLALHGLATPGVLVGTNGVVAFTGGATLPVGGAVLALSALPSLRRPRRLRPLLFLQATLLAGILVLGVTGMLFPNAVPPVPEPAGPLALATLGVGSIFYVVLIVRALRTWSLTRRSSDLAVAVGVAWLGAALPPSLVLDYSQLGWWLGHMFELAGIALVGVAVGLDLSRLAPSRPLVGDLRAADLVAEEEAFLGSHVRALTRRLAEKDEYTERHTRRVALRAVQVGEELGLPSRRLRVLAIGGLLHDIGKLAVPDSILKKPAALTEEEYWVVRQHPQWGRRLLAQLGGFADEVSRLVSSHHEQLDGSGYPRGASAEEIELDTRILTVCDVYDALMSPRVYRPAWTHDEALAYLQSRIGSAFDGRCVEALARVRARERARPARLRPAERAPAPVSGGPAGRRPATASS